MRIILDENMPEAIALDLPGHEVQHVITLGWAGIKNGALLTTSENAGCDVLLTFDKGIPAQQKMAGRNIAVLVLRPDGQGIRALQKLTDEILAALKTIQPGEVRIISNRKNQN